MSDDVTLKKLLEEKTKEKKKVEFIGGGGCLDAEAEMKKLCRVKERLESMKRRLVQFQSAKSNNSDKPASYEQSVIYVPVAELREKAWSPSDGLFFFFFLAV